jgi:hypothetical protein
MSVPRDALSDLTIPREVSGITSETLSGYHTQNETVVETPPTLEAPTETTIVAALDPAVCALVKLTVQPESAKTVENDVVHVAEFVSVTEVVLALL